jgi:hypothetical protein
MEKEELKKSLCERRCVSTAFAVVLGVKAVRILAESVGTSVNIIDMVHNLET